VEAPNEIWAWDISYCRVGDSFWYLIAIHSLYQTRRGSHICLELQCCTVTVGEVRLSEWLVRRDPRETGRPVASWGGPLTFGLLMIVPFRLFWPFSAICEETRDLST